MKLEVRKLKIPDKYNGKFVAYRSFDDETIVASGNDISDAHSQAVEMGYKSAVVIYIPRSDQRFKFGKLAA